jgi:O-antigen chain-terminating methyltransferase
VDEPTDPGPQIAAPQLAAQQIEGAPADLELEKLIAQLPEVYQPIYGRPDLSSSRTAQSARLDVLLDLADGIAEQLGRPIRVLDLGSAQGYLAFRLAERGHAVIGIDYNASNVAVSVAIAARHPQLDTTFFEGDVVDVGTIVDLDGIDLVIGMSVLHHVAHSDGHDRAQA